MYITKAILHRYKWIEILSGISTITIDVLNQIQILIGTNGGGKSSLLRELTPLPSSRNDYYRGGYKELVILHKGITYTVRSDFRESKFGVHFFFKGDENLNVSGLSTLQTALCQEHLGYTQLVDDLTHCRYKISNMSLAERKALLYTLSPSTPDFVIELHKSAKSHLRACKSNLTLLNQRKQDIESKLMPTEELDKLQQEVDKLTKIQSDLFMELHQLELRIKDATRDLEEFRDPVSHNFPEPIDPDKMLRYRQRIQELRYKIFKQGGETATLDSLTQKLTELENTLTAKRAEYAETSAECSRYEESLKEVKHQDQDDCVSIITEQTKILNELEIYKDYPYIKDQDLDHHSKVYFDFMGLVESYRGIESPDTWQYLKNESCRFSMEANLRKFITEETRLSSDLVHTRTELSSLSERQASLPSGPPPTTSIATCSECGYYKHFSTEVNQCTKRITELTANNTTLSTQLSSIKKDISDTQSVLARIKDISSYLDRALSLVSGTVFAKSKEDMIRILSTQEVFVYLKYMKDTLQAQDNLRLIAKAEATIKEADTTLKTLKKVDAPALHVLQEILSKRTSHLNSLRESILELDASVATLKSLQSSYTSLDHLTKRGIEIQSELESYHTYFMLSEYIKYLTQCIQTTLNQEKAEIDAKIFSLTKTITEQHTLQSRYKEEILSMIEIIKKKQNLYTYLELGLSPETGFPYAQIREFTAAITQNVNFILSKIWTSSYKVLYPEDLKSIGDFKVVLGNNDPTPIVKLSKSQKAVLDFAFYIALIYSVGAIDYPVYFDECDDGFDIKHKQTYLDWIKLYMDSSYAPLIFLVSHYSTTYGGFLYKDVICLNKDNIEVPKEANLHVEIVRM